MVNGEKEYLLMTRDKIFNNMSDKELFLLNVKMADLDKFEVDLKEPAYLLSTELNMSTDLFSSAAELRVRACYDAAS